MPYTRLSIPGRLRTPTGVIDVRLLGARPGSRGDFETGRGCTLADLWDFEADGGSSTDQLLARVLPPVSRASFLRGCVREALAAAWSVAVFGRHENRLWDSPERYLVDDTCGSKGVVATRDKAFVAACNAAQGRGTVAHVDPHERIRADMLAEVRALPFMTSQDEPVCTAVFWDHDDVLVSSEPWHTIYFDGPHLFEREMCAAEYWVEKATEYYEIDAPVVSHVLDLLAGLNPNSQAPLPISSSALVKLLPLSLPHRELAISDLFDGGRFVKI